MNGVITPAYASAGNVSVNFTGDITVRNDEDIEVFAEKVRSVMMDVYQNVGFRSV